ncbi:MAG TPA: methyltransferase domain-containing protein [Thermoleophilaceae bacterium]|nr:methyltransferase domain-containing protein [Thermoleophilaceae bacterium]
MLSTALFGESLKIDDFPYRPDLNGLGLSDSPVYAKRLVTKLPGYRNTSYHDNPRLDITDPPAELDGTLDFLISSEVFEHVAPPAQGAFDNAFRLLRPGGVLVLTVPYVLEGETLERFPHLNRHEVSEFEGRPILINRTREGSWEVFDDLIFHGGEGATLEMRRFARESVLRHMAEAGFTDVVECSASCARFGVLWDVDWSLPILGRRGSDAGSPGSPIPQVAAASLSSSGETARTAEDAPQPSMTSEGTQSRLIEWTGERCVPWTDDLQVIYEHLHRYHFAAELRPGGEVLDVGSGEGYGSAILAQSARTVVGVDVDPASIEHSRQTHSQENLRFVQASALELEEHFPERSFDLVVCFELIEHVDEQQQVVATMARVLREDGLLLISTPDRGPYNESRAEANPYHLRELDREELEALLGEHFPNVSLLGQSAATGSYIGLGPGGAEWRESREIVVERQRDQWVRLDGSDPIYLVAAASRAALPPLPAASHLIDRNLELARRAASAGDLEARVGHLERTVADWRRRSGDLRAQRDQAQAQLDSILASRSWRALGIYRRARRRLEAGGRSGSRR